MEKTIKDIKERLNIQAKMLDLLNERLMILVGTMPAVCKVCQEREESKIKEDIKKKKLRKIYGKDGISLEETMDYLLGIMLI